MARASAVHVVLDGSRPPEAFTVKHELVLWLSRHEDPSRLVIWRVADGLRKRPAVRVPAGSLVSPPPARHE
jgi:hypothetical protein